MSQNVLTEKQILIEILNDYKEQPCLWNPSHQYYTNTIKRREQYERLLQKYKLYVPGANIPALKKKIENMRTTYKRERMKVIKSRLNREELEYKPTLWYYDYFKFLDEVDINRNRLSVCLSDDLDEERDTEHLKIEESPPESPIPRKKKKSDIIYLEEENDLEEPYMLSNDLHHSSSKLESAESFGRTVGIQLSELSPMQRFIAEKLISDVIFYGRLEKLTPTAELKVRNDDCLE